MKHLMIDLETLGQGSKAPTASVGAVYFDPATGDLGKEFFAKINIEDAHRYGRIDGSTFKWWLQQSDDARLAISSGKAPIDVVLTKFREFCALAHEDVVVWGNGPTFDMTILEHAYETVLRQPAPWKFWNVRDCRTMKDLATSLGMKIDYKAQGTAHRAIDDAKAQARWVSEIWRSLAGAWKQADRPGR